MSQNGSERPFSSICVHSFVPTSVCNGKIVYTNAPERLYRGVFADLCTLLYPHSHPRNRAKPWIPRHRWFHSSSDAWTLGPEAHAAETVTQLPIQTNSQSLQCIHLGSVSRNCDISKGHMEDAKQIRLTNGLRLCPGLTKNLE